MHAHLNTDTYPTGVQVSDKQIAALSITRHWFHGDWNYTPRGDRNSLTGVPAKLRPAERILVTVLYQRKPATLELLGELFGVTSMTIIRGPTGSTCADAASKQ